MNQEITTEVKNFLSMVSDSIVIETQEQDVQACELGKKINGELKRLGALKKTMTDPINLSLKNIRALFKPAEDAGEKYLRTIKDAHNGFVAEQQRIAREHEARLAEIARQKAEELKEKAKDEAFEGNEEVAKALEQEAIMAETLTPVVAPAVPKVEAVAMKTYWSAEVVDINLVPREYLLPDMNKLNALARAIKGESNIAGVRFVSRQDSSFGRM